MPGVSFDKQTGTVPNIGGRVLKAKVDHHHHHPLRNDDYTLHESICTGLYVTGWLKRGPSGIIGTNRWCAEETVDAIIEDIKKGLTVITEKNAEEVKDKLKRQGIQLVSFDDWKSIEREENRRGKNAGKPSEKITSVEEMLKILKSLQDSTGSNGTPN